MIIAIFIIVLLNLIISILILVALWVKGDLEAVKKKIEVELPKKTEIFEWHPPQNEEERVFASVLDKLNENSEGKYLP